MKIWVCDAAPILGRNAVVSIAINLPQRRRCMLVRVFRWVVGESIKLCSLYFQVGGHTRLLLLNQSTVIKPLNIRELDFYQNIPSDIQMFVPKYKGRSHSDAPINEHILFVDISCSQCVCILIDRFLFSCSNSVGVMQATSMSGTKLEKRYSPSFQEDPNRKQSASKRKRDDILRLVSQNCIHSSPLKVYIE